MLQTVKWTLLLSLLAALMLVAVACGGNGDGDENTPDDDEGSGSENGGSSRNSDNDVEIPDLKAVQYTGGKVHIEISGDEDLELDADGGGFGNEGFALLTYGSNKATIILSFQNGDDEEPGSLSITTAEFAMGGGWGQDCSVSFEDSANGLSGEFECDDVEGIRPGSIDTVKADIKGTFSATQ